MSTTFFEWTKRLGQQHFAMGGGSTLCGMPMLGNNYARDYYEEDKVPCQDCQQRMAIITDGETHD